MLPRFQGALEVTPVESWGWRFRTHTDSREGDFRLEGLFTNRRHTDEVKWSTRLGGDEECVPTWLECTVHRPEPGCLAMAELIHWLPPGSLLPSQPSLANSRVARYGYAAFLFDGTVWRPWHRPWDIEMCHDGTDGLAVVVGGLLGAFVVANSRDHRHRLLMFAHVLDYCALRRSLSDILAIEAREERGFREEDRRRILLEMLRLVRTLKGAVRSKTAARLEQLLGELSGEIPPF